MDKISVVLIVRNEESKIRDCLTRITWADEIVVVDQSSTDRTVAIAREFTDKIFIVPAYGVCEAHRMSCLHDCSHDWVLFLDADEWVTPKLAKEIRSKLHDPKGCTSFYLGRKNYFLGKWIRGGGWYPAYSIKLFKKGFAFFPTVVHQDGYAIGGKTGHLQHKTLHFTYSSLSQFFEKLDRYTTHSAQEAYKLGKRVTPFNCAYLFIFKPFLYFIRKFILWFGFIDGHRGLIIAFSSSATLFIHSVKIWELQRAESAPSRGA